MSIFIKNIKKLVNVREAAPSAPLRGEEMLSLPCLDGAWLLTEEDRISRLGRMKDLQPEELEALERSSDEVIDAEGRMVFPSYCDSHTHLVYAGSRERPLLSGDCPPGRRYPQFGGAAAQYPGG